MEFLVKFWTITYKSVTWLHFESGW